MKGQEQDVREQIREEAGTAERTVNDEIARTPEEMAKWAAMIHEARSRSFFDLGNSLLYRFPELELLVQHWPGIGQDEELFRKALSLASAAYQKGLADGLALCHHATGFIEAMLTAQQEPLPVGGNAA